MDKFLLMQDCLLCACMCVCVNARLLALCVRAYVCVCGGTMDVWHIHTWGGRLL